MNSLIWRHGLANLNRPGSHATPVFVALGIGVMFTVAVYLMQSSLLKQIVRSAPQDFPNLVLIGIPEKDKDPLWQFFRGEPSIIDSGVPIPSLPGRLRAVNGIPLEEYMSTRQASRSSEERHEGEDNGRGSRRYGRWEFQLTWGEKLPPDARITEGEWWNEKPAEPLVSVAEYFARNLQIHPGTLLEFNIAGRSVQARVASVREVLFVRPGSNNAFIFSPGTLDGLPASYIANLRIRPESVGNIQRQLFLKFPTITSIHVGEILALVQQLLDRITLVIQFVAGFAIVAGCVILASAISATRQRRIKESVIIKTLGATRVVIARMQSVEFLVLGFSAGAVGSLAANALASYLLGNLLDTQYDFRWESILGGAVGTALLTMATGRIASRGILNQKPLQVLREE
jgi:putative ABC transport system permease protein